MGRGRGNGTGGMEGEGWEKVLVELGEDGRAATGVGGAQGGEKETGKSKQCFRGNQPKAPSQVVSAPIGVF